MTSYNLIHCPEFGVHFIVAGTDNDADNLSIVMTARTMNPRLFVVMRQNRHANDALFQAVQADLVMQASEIIVHEVIALLTAPLLARFLRGARGESNAWANELVSRISAVAEERVPEIWEVVVDDEQAWAVASALAAGEGVTVGHLSSDPRARTHPLPAIALLVARGLESFLLPGPELALEAGDHLLFCGRRGSAGAMAWTLQNGNTLDYVLSGGDRLATRRSVAAPGSAPAGGSRGSDATPFPPAQ